jgi:hypothetical protein
MKALCNSRRVGGPALRHVNGIRSFTLDTLLYMETVQSDESDGFSRVIYRHFQDRHSQHEPARRGGTARDDSGAEYSGGPPILLSATVYPRGSFSESFPSGAALLAIPFCWAGVKGACFGLADLHSKLLLFSRFAGLIACFASCPSLLF